MKYIITMVLLLSMHYDVCSQKNKPSISFKKGNDTVAYSVIQRNLDFVKKFIKTKNDTTFLEIGSVISFFIELTGIPPESFYDDNQNPLWLIESDYKRWEVWFIANKQNIHWDIKNKLIVIKKSLTPYMPIN